MLEIAGSQNPLIHNRLPARKEIQRVMPREQENYYLGWHDLIQTKKDSLPESARSVYLAMGPDLSTPLLLFNAKTVEGIDLCPWEYEQLKESLTNWTPDSVSADLMSAKERRYSGGFWNYDDYKLLKGWYQPLMLELVSLGIDPLTVQCSQNETGSLLLQFDWCHPSDPTPLARTIILNSKLSFDQWLARQDAVEKFDYYLDKGVNIAFLKSADRLPALEQKMNRRAFLMSSVEYDAKVMPNSRYASVLEGTLSPAIRQETEEINMDKALTNQMHRQMRQRFPMYAWGYGWELRGYRLS